MRLVCGCEVQYSDNDNNEVRINVCPYHLGEAQTLGSKPEHNLNRSLGRLLEFAKGNSVVLIICGAIGTIAAYDVIMLLG